MSPRRNGSLIVHDVQGPLSVLAGAATSRPREPTRRLAIVTPHHGPEEAGGSEYQIECLLGVLAPLGRYDITYIAHIVTGAEQARSYRIVQIGRAARQPRWGYVTHAPRLYRALQALGPHVIYQRVGCGYTGICAEYARRHGTRLIWHVASDADVMPGVSLYGRNPLRRVLEKRSVEHGIRHATCIVAQTRCQARLLSLHYDRAPNAIISNFHPEPAERIDKSGPPIVAWVGSLKRLKQPEAFLRLAGSLADLGEARFVMAGPLQADMGDQDWSAALQKQIASTANVEYLGALRRPEVNRLLARAHVLVSTSPIEGFPNIFIQAWLRDAAVASLHVDPDGILQREGLGIACADSEQRLAESVRALLLRPELRHWYAARAASYARVRHSLDNALALIRLFEPESERAMQCGEMP